MIYIDKNDKRKKMWLTSAHRGLVINTLKENTMYILKMAVLSEEMPLLDRIHAGELYVNMGGNGTIKKKYEHLLEEYEKREKYNKI